VRSDPADRFVHAQSKAQFAPQSEDQPLAFVAIAQSNSGALPDIRSFSK
jgi:hypothetical protein